jgi:hypothetical protein
MFIALSAGCRRVYFGMSVSAGYLEAAVTMAAVAREAGVSALVNMSQMTVSEMSIQNTTPSQSAAAALAERANVRVVGPACCYYPANNVPGELFAVSRSERAQPRPH